MNMLRIHVEDILAVVGLCLLGYGVWWQWGWPVFMVVVGSTLILFADRLVRFRGLPPGVARTDPARFQ
jgi:hypothetical protein